MFVQHVDTNPQLSVGNARLKIYDHHNKSLIVQPYYPQSRRVCYLQSCQSPIQTITLNTDAQHFRQPSHTAKTAQQKNAPVSYERVLEQIKTVLYECITALSFVQFARNKRTSKREQSS